MTTLGSNINSCSPFLPRASQGDSAATDGNTAQKSLAPPSHKSLAFPSASPNSSWGSVSQDAGSDFGHSCLNAVNPPKIGSRFSRESSKILTQWFSNHYDYPYPSKGAMKTLQYQTGLSKTQIQNWLANTRRREKMHQSNQYSRQATSGINSGTASIDIPERPDTPAIQTGLQHNTMAPLERWVESPPESEPATVTDIVNAVQSAKSTQTWSLSKPIDDGSGLSNNESSDNSYGTSSGGSLASIYSHGSGDSLTDTLAPARNTSRRRRRWLLSKPRRSLVGKKQQPFQCTFCAETFKTKYDWQRHEKSLHIPLERWLCSPDGPLAINPDTGQPECVFCGKLEPSDSHMKSHNPNSCQERIFNRKDHLKQHLHLVHKSKPIETVMKDWKTSTPTIRSRCGFCGTSLDSWIDRVEHLGDHFKMGKTMADWTGDWGFEDVVADTLENAIPPYLLGEERNSPFPFEASDISPESPRTAYELLAVELSCFVEMHQYRTGQIPNSDAMQLEACRIIFASEVLSLETDPAAQPSWLRDLVLSNEILATEAQFLAIRTPSEGRLRTLEIRGKNTLFEDCPLEAQLHNFVLAEKMPNQTVIYDTALQTEACKLLTQMQQSLELSLSDFVFTWFIVLLQSPSTKWLSHFRRRAHLPAAQCTSSSALPELIGHWTPWPTSSTILSHPYTDTHDLATLGRPSEDAICGTGEHLKAALDEPHMTCHKNAQSNIGSSMLLSSRSYPLDMNSSMGEENFIHRPVWTSSAPTSSSPEASTRTICTKQMEADSREQTDGFQIGAYMLHDPNFYKWLGRELGRWVTSIMSPNNPNCHVPSDEEIQHHARYLLYNDDDPWNQTAADNPEWLHRFKVDVGIVPK